MRSDKEFALKTDLSQERERDAGTKEFAQMLDGELAEDLEDVLLNGFGILIRGVGVVGNSHRREIGAVDRVVDRNSDLKLRVVVDDSTGDTCPHRLKS